VITDPLCSEYADDPDMRELLAEFVARLEATCRQLEEAVRNGDADTARRIGHQLKGSGGGYGFPDLTAAGAELERALDRAGIHSDDVRTAAERLTGLCRRARG
jgi:HPt (histidine-containing phosphotransfer) domain-containing protein